MAMIYGVIVVAAQDTRDSSSRKSGRGTFPFNVDAHGVRINASTKPSRKLHHASESIKIIFVDS